MAKIFLSYRREDTAGYAGRIAERLSKTFGEERVFRDLEDIQPGVNFAEEIQRNVAKSDVLLALIGPRWLSVTGSTGTRRLEDPQDFVRLEIAAALDRSMKVIPVLVQKAAMPTPDALPQPLKPLAMHQAIELSDTRWEYDMDQLINVLRGKVSSAASAKPYWIVPTTLAVVATVAGWFNFQTSPLKTTNTQGAQVTGQAEKIHLVGVGVPDVKIASNVTGHWLGSWAGPQGKEFHIRFNFEAQGPILMGSVHYPTGDGGIHDGKVEGDRLVFVTRHTPQFEDKEVTISYLGKINGDEIEFVMQRPNGAQRLVAKRILAPEPKR